MDQLNHTFAQEAADAPVCDDAERQRQARLLKLAIGTAYGIGVVRGSGGTLRAYMANAMGIYRFAADFADRQGPDIRRYMDLAPLPKDYTDLLEALPGVIERSFRLSETNYPMDTGMAIPNIVNHLKKIMGHPACPIARGLVPPTHYRRALRIGGVDTSTEPVAAPS